MKDVTIRPVRRLRGAVTVPGDKSISHRALILASQATGESRITGLSPGEDVRHTAQVLTDLGAACSSWGETPFTVSGVGPGGWTEPRDILDCGNSGTGIRLLAGMVSAHPFFCVLSGDSSLRSRPMGRIVEPLRLMGATINGRSQGSLPPLAVTGSRLRGISYRSAVASAQVKSCLLLAGLLAEGVTEVTEPSLSRDHTERMFATLGLEISRRETTVRVEGGQTWSALDLAVPGDFSAAAFLLAGALIVPDSEVTVRNVGVNPTRTGFLDVLVQMGADITISNAREQCGEPVADLNARTSALRGISIPPELVPSAIDEFPVLTTLALFAEGKTLVRGAGELRFKESDRISAMAAELRRLGGTVRERDDGLQISGGGPLEGALCDSHGDHRVAMALAVAGCALGSQTVVQNAACVDTSFPGFWTVMESLGGDVAQQRKP